MVADEGLKDAEIILDVHQQIRQEIIAQHFVVEELLNILSFDS